MFPLLVWETENVVFILSKSYPDKDNYYIFSSFWLSTPETFRVFLPLLNLLFIEWQVQKDFTIQSNQ